MQDISLSKLISGLINFRLETYNKNDVIYSERNEIKNLYFVKQGEVEFSKEFSSISKSTSTDNL